MADIIDQVDVCSIVHGSGFDPILSLFAWRMKRQLDWTKVPSFVSSRCLPFNFCSEVACGLSASRKARVTVDDRNKSVLSPLLSEVPFLHLTTTWTEARRKMADYFHRANETALPDSSFDELVLASVDGTAVTVRGAPPAFVATNPDSLRPEVAEWRESSSLAPLSFADFCNPRLPVPTAPS